MRNASCAFRQLAVCWLLAARQPAAPPSPQAPIATALPLASGAAGAVTTSHELALLTIPPATGRKANASPTYTSSSARPRAGPRVLAPICLLRSIV